MSMYNDNEVLIKPPGIIAGSKLDQEITELLRKKSLEDKTRRKDIEQPAYPRHYLAPLAYVTNFMDNTVSVIEIRTGLKVMDIPVGNRPYGIAISPDQKFVYVANMDDATLSIISTRKNRVVNTIDLNTPFSTDNPLGVKVSPCGKLIYVAGFLSSNILVVNAYLQQVVAEVPLPEGTGPYVLDITADNRLAYVTLLLVNKVAVVDLNANLSVKFIDVGNWPSEITIAKRNSLALVVNDESNSLSAINTIIAEASPNTIDLNARPADVVLSARGNIAYVSNWDDSNVEIVDVFTHSKTGSIPVDDRPYRLALTADDRFLVVSNRLSDTVTIIDTRKREVKGTATAGYHPAFIVILNKYR